MVEKKIKDYNIFNNIVSSQHHSTFEPKKKKTTKIVF